MDLDLQRYQALINQVKTGEKEVKTFLSFLEEKTSWHTSPASTRFHNSFARGLLRNSILVAELLLKLKKIMSPDMNNETSVIAGLFHDVGKVGLPGKPLYLSNTEKRTNYGERSYIINPLLVYVVRLKWTNFSNLSLRYPGGPGLCFSC